VATRRPKNEREIDSHLHIPHDPDRDLLRRPAEGTGRQRMDTPRKDLPEVIVEETVRLVAAAEVTAMIDADRIRILHAQVKEVTITRGMDIITSERDDGEVAVQANVTKSPVAEDTPALLLPVAPLRHLRILWAD
jgi:hypothetical protein